MNTISMVSHQPFQRLHPLSLLAQLTSRQTNGCLQVVSESTSWFIYLDQGKLTFATSSLDPFERLDRHLRHLNRQVPALASAVRVQVRLLFEHTVGIYPSSSADYQAIHWLVEQQYLNLSQAAALIEEIAKEAIEPFLKVTEGMYEVIDKQSFEKYPNLCLLDPRLIVEQCHNRSQQRQTHQSATKVQSPDSIRNLLNEHSYPSNVSQNNPQKAPQFTQVGQPNELNGATNGLRTKPSGSVSKAQYTVACIDDSPTVLQAINTFLDDSNFSVLMINDPVKALMQVIRSRPDMVLLDVGMPNLDGYELCSLLRRHPSFKNIPIIMVTGHTGFIDRAKARLVGASGYLTKPFTQPELLKMMFKHLM
jgi:two-component system, chemotaxis family, response regulator PixG